MKLELWKKLKFIEKKNQKRTKKTIWNFDWTVIKKEKENREEGPERYLRTKGKFLFMVRHRKRKQQQH